MIDHDDADNPDQTSSTLLDGLRREDDRSWRQLYTVYAPLIGHWIRSNGIPESNVEDVFQCVCTKLLKAIKSFERQEGNARFRGFLKKITYTESMEFHRRQKDPAPAGGTHARLHLAELPDSMEESRDDVLAEKKLFLEGIVQVVKSKVKESTWDCFKRTELDGQNATEVAEELGLSPPAVRKNRQRVKGMIANLREVYGMIS